MGAVCFCAAAPLEEGMHKEVTSSMLTIAVIGAKGLWIGDLVPHETSWIYCKVKALVEGATPMELHTTQRKQAALEPLWKEELTVDVAELWGGVLEFTVWEERSEESTRCLGAIKVDVDQMAGHDGRGFHGRLSLEGNVEGMEPCLIVKARRTWDGKYPKEPPSEVLMTLTRDPVLDWGLDLDFQDPTCLWVKAVKPGPVQTYNEAAAPDERLRVGDFIVGVNGVKGTTTELLHEFKHASVKVLVKRPLEIRAIINKTSSKLGLSISTLMGTSLLITEVSDGPIKTWNEAQTDDRTKLLVGDRIVGVAGLSGKSQELMTWLGRTGRFQVTAVRPADSSPTVAP